MSFIFDMTVLRAFKAWKWLCFLGMNPNLPGKKNAKMYWLPYINKSYTYKCYKNDFGNPIIFVFCSHIIRFSWPQGFTFLLFLGVSNFSSLLMFAHEKRVKDDVKVWTDMKKESWKLQEITANPTKYLFCNIKAILSLILTTFVAWFIRLDNCNIGVLWLKLRDKILLLAFLTFLLKNL